MASLFDAINAAAAALNKQTENQPKQRVQPKVAGSNGQNGSNGRVKPKAQPTKPIEPNKPTEGAAPKGSTAAPKTQPAAKATPKAAPKTAQPKKQEPIDISKLKVKFAIPEDFKMAIRLYMEGRAKADSAIARKMKADGKSIDGCCEYIYRIMMRRAAKQLTERKNTGIGVTGDPDEVYGMAMHYYDESEETLKAELNGKEA